MDSLYRGEFVPLRALYSRAHREVRTGRYCGGSCGGGRGSRLGFDGGCSGAIHQRSHLSHRKKELPVVKMIEQRAAALL